MKPGLAAAVWAFHSCAPLPTTLTVKIEDVKLISQGDDDDDNDIVSLQDASPDNTEGQQSNTIIFNASKGELFTPANGFKSLVRKLRSNWKVIT